eukprot:scaffold443773_cov59-Attheya_sp.AAC.1
MAVIKADASAAGVVSKTIHCTKAATLIITKLVVLDEAASPMPVPSIIGTPSAAGCVWRNSDNLIMAAVLKTAKTARSRKK